jgi:ketosteroid isomerase-like protein
LVVSGLIVAAGLVAGYLGLRPPLSDADRIRALVADVTQAINQRALERVLACVADDYHDSQGHTKADLRRLLWQAGRSGGSYYVRSAIRGLVISGGGMRASVVVEAEVWRGESGERENYELQATLEKRGRRWLVVRAEGWQQAAAED